MQRASKYWQIAGVIVAIISISFNVYQYAENKAKEYTIKELGGRLTDATIRLLGSENRVAEHEARIVDLSTMVKEATLRMQQHRNDADAFKDQALKYKTMAEYYEGKYKDVSPILDLTDSEHYEYFLEWTANKP